MFYKQNTGSVYKTDSLAEQDSYKQQAFKTLKYMISQKQQRNNNVKIILPIVHKRNHNKLISNKK